MIERAFPTVLVLCALDERDDSALAAVRALADHRLVERVIVVHVSERERGLLGRAPAEAPRPPALDDRVARLVTELRGVAVVGIHATGRPTEEIARIADREEADLVVVGRNRAAGGRDGWGGHGIALLRTADCPVLLVPDGARLAFGRAVLGMDFSENAVEALERVARFVEVVEPVAVVDPSAEGETDDEAREGVEEAWRILLPRFDGADLPPLRIVGSSEPGDALLGASEGADLLVVGSRGLTPLAAVLLGSTAERLGGRTSTPLLVYRKKGEHQGLFGALFRGR